MTHPSVDSTDDEIRAYVMYKASKKDIVLGGTVNLHLSGAASPNDKDLATIRFDVQGTPVYRSTYRDEYPNMIVE